VDLEIGVLGEMGPEIRVQALFRDRFVGVVRKGHPLGQLKEVTTSHYSEWNTLWLHAGELSGPVDDALAEVGFRTKSGGHRSRFSRCAGCGPGDGSGCAGSGLVFIHRSAVADLSVFELPVKTRGITVSLLWHPRSDVDPATVGYGRLYVTYANACYRKTELSYRKNGRNIAPRVMFQKDKKWTWKYARPDPRTMLHG
jgi:DNA-binding transcriptional LysR family regulator